MAEVIWTEPALWSLDEIGDYIALDNPEAAKKVIRTVFEKVDLLEVTPLMGNISNELKSTPYRGLSIQPVYVFYRLEGDKVIIIHVERAERDFQFTRITKSD